MKDKRYKKIYNLAMMEEIPKDELIHALLNYLSEFDDGNFIDEVEDEKWFEAYFNDEE